MSTRSVSFIQIGKKNPLEIQRKMHVYLNVNALQRIAWYSYCYIVANVKI